MQLNLVANTSKIRTLRTKKVKRKKQIFFPFFSYINDRKGDENLQIMHFFIKEKKCLEFREMRHCV